MMMTVMERGFACVVNRVALSLPPSFLERGGSYGMEHGWGHAHPTSAPGEELLPSR